MAATTFPMKPVYRLMLRQAQHERVWNPLTPSLSKDQAARLAGGHLAWLMRANEVEQAGAALPQVVDRCRVGHADETGRIERLARRDGDARLREQRVGKVEGRAEAVHRQHIADVDEQV